MKSDFLIALTQLAAERHLPKEQVLQAIEPSPTPIDVVTRNCGLPVHRVLATLSVLEMRHLVRRVSGTHVARR